MFHLSKIFNCKIPRYASLIIISFYSDAIYSDNSITVANWKNHPEIIEVNKISKEIDRKIRSGELLVRLRNFNTEPYSEIEKRCYWVSDELVLSGAGSVVRKISSHMQRHILITIQYIFDKNNVLRFIYATQDEKDDYSYRAYFNENGRMIFALNLDEGISYQIQNIKKYMFLRKINGEQALKSYRKNPPNCISK